MSTLTLSALTGRLDTAAAAARVAEEEEVGAALHLLAVAARAQYPNTRYVLLWHSDQGDWWSDVRELLADDWQQVGEENVVNEAVTDAAAHFYDQRAYLLDAVAADDAEVGKAFGNVTRTYAKVLDLDKIIAQHA